jgi:hypothetical protein
MLILMEATRTERAEPWKAQPCCLATCLALAVLLASCRGYTSSYMPSPSPRVQTMVKDGQLVYVRDGKVFKSLPKAVSGNADAERAAKKYTRVLDSAKFWYWWLWGGLAAEVGSVVVIDAADEREHWTLAGVALFGVAMGALTLGYIGVVKHGNPRFYVYDAVNRFNDAVQEAPGEEDINNESFVQNPSPAPSPSTDHKEAASP